MSEAWKDIPGYEGLYKISDLGNIYSTITNKIRKLMRDKDGYLQLNLCKNKEVWQQKVHRLVAQTFIPNVNNYKEINHKDENKANNSVINLEWCTRKYNMNYGNRSFIAAEKRCMPVIQTDLSGNEIARYKSVKEAARHIKKYQSNISRCCRGMRSMAYGYKWGYV